MHGEARHRTLRVRSVLGDSDPLHGPGGTLRIGCVAELALQRVQSFVGALYAFDPHLETELRHLPSAAQVRALRSGELHLGLLYGAGDLDGIEAVPIVPGRAARGDRAGRPPPRAARRGDAGGPARGGPADRSAPGRSRGA